MRRYELELSVLVAAEPAVAAVAYDADIITATVDWISIAANDYYEPDAKGTAYLLPLKSDNTYPITNIVSIMFMSTYIIITFIMFLY